MQFYKIRFDYETGNIIDDCNSLECLGGGGKGGGGTVYVPQPTASETPAPPPTAAQAATFETAEDINKDDANKKGAKSLQIPLTDSTAATTDAAKAVGTV